MNTFSLTQRRFGARTFAALTIVSLLISTFPVAFFVAHAERPDSPPVRVGGPPATYVICHETHGSNDYVQPPPLPVVAITNAGHFGHNSGGSDDRGDIIPPIPDDLPAGKNWDAVGHDEHVLLLWRSYPRPTPRIEPIA